MQVDVLSLDADVEGLGLAGAVGRVGQAAFQALVGLVELLDARPQAVVLLGQTAPLLLQGLGPGLELARNGDVFVGGGGLAAGGLRRLLAHRFRLRRTAHSGRMLHRLRSLLRRKWRFLLLLLLLVLLLLLLLLLLMARWWNRVGTLTHEIDQLLDVVVVVLALWDTLKK